MTTAGPAAPGTASSGPQEATPGEPRSRSYGRIPLSDVEFVAGGAQEAATPGQAAYEAYMAAIGLTAYLPGDTWASHADEHPGWEAAADVANRAGLAKVLAEAARYKAEAKDWALKAAQACNERDEARAKLAELEQLAASWAETEPAARLTRDEIVEQCERQACARSLRAALEATP